MAPDKTRSKHRISSDWSCKRKCFCGSILRKHRSRKSALPVVCYCLWSRNRQQKVAGTVRWSTPWSWFCACWFFVAMTAWHKCWPKLWTNSWFLDISQLQIHVLRPLMRAIGWKRSFKDLDKSAILFLISLSIRTCPQNWWKQKTSWPWMHVYQSVTTKEIRLKQKGNWCCLKCIIIRFSDSWNICTVL